MIDRIEINLLPAEYRVRKKGMRVPREVVYPLLVIALGGLFVSYYTMDLDGKIGKARQDISDVTQRIAKEGHIKAEIEALQRDRQIVYDKIRALQRISVNKGKWVHLMEVLCAYLPRYTWLTSIEETVASPTSSALRLQGSTYSFPEVANFMTKLTESEYVTNVDLSSIDQTGDARKAFTFSLTAALNPDAGLGSPDIKH